MVGTKRWISLAVVMGLILASAPGVWAEQTEQATKPATTKKVTTQAAGPKEFLEAVPADAWGFIAVPSLQRLDKKLGALSEKLNFPLESPLGLALAQLGIAEGVREKAGLGVVVLDPTEYGMPPDMLAILVPTTDASALLDVFDPQDAGEGMSTIDLMGKRLYAMPKGGFVVLGLEKSSVKHVAEAKKGIKKSLKPDQIARYNEADLFALLNLRPAIDMVKPLAGQFVAMLMMGSMDADPDKGEGIQKSAQEIVDLLDQLSALEIALGLDNDGLQVSFYLTFTEDGSITKKIAEGKAPSSGLLTGLPKDKYVVAMGVQGSEPGESTLHKGLMELVMSRPEVSDVLSKEKMAELQKLGEQLRAKLGGSAISLSTLPKDADGMLALTVVMESTDVKGSIPLLRNLIESYKGMFKDKDVAKVLQGLTCKPGAETIGGAAVDHITLDLSKLEADDEQMAGAIATIKKVLGKEGLLVRLAPAGDKRIVLTLGGGAKRMEQVLSDAAGGKSPLAEDAGVMKARKKMPKRRMFEMYLAVDQLLKLIRGVSGSQDVPMMEPIDAPLGVALSAEKNYGRLDLILPTELIVEIKNMVLQAMFGGGFGGGEQGAEPSF